MFDLPMNDMGVSLLRNRTERIVSQLNHLEIPVSYYLQQIHGYHTNQRESGSGWTVSHMTPPQNPSTNMS